MSCPEFPHYIFDVAAFRIQFPAFSNPTTFPTLVLQQYWDMGNCYVANDGYGALGCCQLLALNLITAHLTALSVIIGKGQVPGLMQTATIDKVSVGLTPPPLQNQWGWWLSTTPYGQELYALLQAKSVGGFYVGGLPERFAIRKVYGTFGT